MVKHCKAILTLLQVVLLVVSVSPRVAAQQTNSPSLVRIVNESGAMLPRWESALEKRKGIQFPAGALRDSNAANIQRLTEIVEATRSLQQLIDAGPTADEALLIEREWTTVADKAKEVGLPVGSAEAKSTAPAMPKKAEPASTTSSTPNPQAAGSSTHA